MGLNVRAADRADRRRRADHLRKIYLNGGFSGRPRVSLAT